MRTDRLPHRLPSLALAPAVALLALLGAAPARADVEALRPSSTLTSGWTVTPPGSSAASVLADPVFAPAAPATSGDIRSHGNGPVVTEVGVPAPSLAPGQTITGVRAWAHLSTGSGRSVTFELRSGSATLAFGSYPAGQSATWRSVAPSALPSQTAMSSLRLRFTLNGSWASSDARVDAAYVEVTTTAPASGAPGGSGAPAPGDGGTAPGTSNGAEGTTGTVPGAVVSLPRGGRLAVDSRGRVALTISCPATATAGCVGAVNLRRPVSARRSAHSARRGRSTFPIGGQTFTAGAGRKRRVTVRLSRVGRSLLHRRGRLRVTVAVRTGSGASARTTRRTALLVRSR
jgi:hypothetical protein